MTAMKYFLLKLFFIKQQDHFHVIYLSKHGNTENTTKDKSPSHKYCEWLLLPRQLLCPFGKAKSKPNLMSALSGRPQAFSKAVLGRPDRGKLGCLTGLGALPVYCRKSPHSKDVQDYSSKQVLLWGTWQMELRLLIIGLKIGRLTYTT